MRAESGILFLKSARLVQIKAGRHSPPSTKHSSWATSLDTRLAPVLLDTGNAERERAAEGSNTVRGDWVGKDKERGLRGRDDRVKAAHVE